MVYIIHFHLPSQQPRVAKNTLHEEKLIKKTMQGMMRSPQFNWVRSRPRSVKIINYEDHARHDEISSV